MSVKRKRDKRKRSGSPKPAEKPLDPPKKRRKTCPIEPIQQTTNEDTCAAPKSQAPPPPEPNTVCAPDHVNESTTSTPKPSEEGSTPNPIHHTDLGSLMSGKRPGLFTRREVIIGQLQAMAETGAIPMDLQHQIQSYYHKKNTRKQDMDEPQTNTNSLNPNPESNTPYPVPAPLHQPIVTEESSDNDVEESWNCNVLVCCLFAVFFVAFMYVLSVQFNAPHVTYCDTMVGPMINSTMNCTTCPQNANCTNGRARCEGKLHPVKGCLDKKEYAQRLNVEKLYVMLYQQLKHTKRKRFINCDPSIKVVWSKERIEAYFNNTQTKFVGSMNQLWNLLEEDEYKKEISENGEGYFATLPQWEYDASKKCTKFNMLLIAKTYGLELSVSVICIAVVLVSWRKLTMHDDCGHMPV